MEMKRYVVAQLNGKKVVTPLRKHDCLVAIRVSSTRGLIETEHTFEMTRKQYFDTVQCHACADRRCGKGVA